MTITPNDFNSLLSNLYWIAEPDFMTEKISCFFYILNAVSIDFVCKV